MKVSELVGVMTPKTYLQIGYNTHEKLYFGYSMNAPENLLKKEVYCILPFSERYVDNGYVKTRLIIKAILED